MAGLRRPGIRPRRAGGAFRFVRRSLTLAAVLSLAAHACAAATLPEGRVVHGPFEIVAGVRRVSTGTFPNQGGNPFATREVSEFQVRWKGKPVATPGGNRDFWRVLRLPAAPRPALLLVTTGFVLATEDDAGQLQLRPITSESSSLAEVQWLDARDGQPGPSLSFGIEAVPDLETGTRLAGGRWLRLGSRSVLDVASLTVHPVDPWVPIVPGVPITSLSREGDEVRMLSPGRTQYVLAASGIDYDDPERGDAHGLLVVDIASGIATELRVDRRRFRFAGPDDIDAAWIAHHFEWRRDPAGRERLTPRERFAPWPWRARVRETSPGTWQLEVPRIDAAFVSVLRRLVEAEPGAEVRDASQPWGPGLAITLDGCALDARAFGVDSSTDDDRRVAVWPSSELPRVAPVAVCERAVRRIAGLIDAELATGRHDALLKLGSGPERMSPTSARGIPPPISRVRRPDDSPRPDGC